MNEIKNFTLSGLDIAYVLIRWAIPIVGIYNPFGEKAYSLYFIFGTNVSSYNFPEG
jgi:hypothetical protein